jgi:hypothetical protein
MNTGKNPYTIPTVAGEGVEFTLRLTDSTLGVARRVFDPERVSRHALTVQASEISETLEKLGVLYVKADDASRKRAITKLITVLKDCQANLGNRSESVRKQAIVIAKSAMTEPEPEFEAGDWITRSYASSPEAELVSDRSFNSRINILVRFTFNEKDESYAEPKPVFAVRNGRYGFDTEVKFDNWESAKAHAETLYTSTVELLKVKHAENQLLARQALSEAGLL